MGMEAEMGQKMTLLAGHYHDQQVLPDLEVLRPREVRQNGGVEVVVVLDCHPVRGVGEHFLLLHSHPQMGTPTEAALLRDLTRHRDLAALPRDPEVRLPLQEDRLLPDQPFLPLLEAHLPRGQAPPLRGPELRHPDQEDPRPRPKGDRMVGRGEFLDLAMGRLVAAINKATAEGNVVRCNALRGNLETLEKLKEQHNAGVDISAEVNRLRASMG